MTIINQDYKEFKVTDGVIVEFITNLRFDNESWVKCFVTPAGEDPSGEPWPPEEVFDFTVVLNADQELNAGGVVTFSTAPETGVLAIVRIVPFTQLIDYTAYGAFPAESHEEALDKLTMAIMPLAGLLDTVGSAIPLLSDTETQELSAGQVVVTFINSISSASLYINGLDADNGRLVLGVDYTYNSSTQEATLSESRPEGTLITAQRSGTFDPLPNQEIVVHENVKAMQASDIAVNTLVRTKGYYVSGDGGGADYLIAVNQVFHNYGDHLMVNGNVAVLQTNTEVYPEQFGANSYQGLYTDQPSSSVNINAAYQYAISKGLRVNLGGRLNKFFLDDVVVIDHSASTITGGTFEVLTSYTGVVVRLGTLDLTQSVSNAVWDNLTIQTTLEDSPTASRADKEGQYIGVLHDTSKRPVFNNKVSDWSIKRPLVGLMWDGNDAGTIDDWSTSNIYTRLSILGFKTAIQVKSTAGNVEVNKLDSPSFFSQRQSNGAICFDVQKGQGFIVNSGVFWNDDSFTFNLFSITSPSTQTVVTLNGGYWEAGMQEFLHTQVSVSGDIKVTTKIGGTGANVFSQPNVTGSQVDNLVNSEPDKWKLTSGTIAQPTEYWQSRPMYELDGVAQYNIGAELRFEDINHIVFSMWMMPSAADTSYLEIFVTYDDASTERFSSAYATSTSSPQLVGVDLTPNGFATGKVPTRLAFTAYSGSAPCDIGIPVINMSACMPLYNVPLNTDNLPRLAPSALAANSATPKIRDNYWHYTQNTVATTLTEFADGFAGQIIMVQVKDVNTSIDLTNVSNLRGNNPTGGVSVYALGNSDVIKAEKHYDGRWYCQIIRGSGL